jgi:hypothetical protein
MIYRMNDRPQKYYREGMKFSIKFQWWPLVNSYELLGPTYACNFIAIYHSILRQTLNHGISE